jgi:DNA polymerase-1
VKGGLFPDDDAGDGETEGRAPRKRPPAAPGPAAAAPPAPPEGKGRRRLFLLDGTALAYRSFHALARSRLTDRQGRPTGAVFGFTSTLFRILRREAPDHLAVAFDPKGPTFRHERYADYKATREKMPDELVEQMPRVREVVRALGFPVLEVPGWEADDVLATVAKRAAAEGARVYLVTGDKDLFQLVDDRVTIYNLLARGEDVEVLDAEGVEGKFGVPPDRVADVLALMGDASDNVPGVKGIGPKTAVELVKRFGSLEEVLARSAEVEKPRIREALERDAAVARLSYELVKIPCDAPVDFSFEDAAVGPPDRAAVEPLFEELQFRRFLAELPRGGPTREEGRRYRVVRTPADLDALLAELRAAPLFTFDTETTGTDPLLARPVGLSFATEPLAGWYVPLNLDPPILGGAPGSDAPRVLEALRPILEDPARPKAGQNAKYDLLVYRTAGVRPAGLVHDTMVLSFLLDSRERTHNLDDLALRHLDLRKIPTSDLLGKGKEQTTMDALPVERVAEYACEDADATLRVLRVLEPRLAGSGVERLYREVEMPLVGVLADMEERGIRVDRAALERMGVDLAAREEALAAGIRELAGAPDLNVNSTQQIGAVLFERLQVQGKRKAKRTKTGYRTDVETLEQYAEHPIVGKILEYRGCAKLRSTYLEPLPRLVNPRTGRLHTSFSQIGAITGRLSSSDPNLQNIPVRTEEGRAIRRCFVPGAEGWRLVSADYSQIELRILAHLADDPGLLDAFRGGEDIHRATAARIFGLLPAAVTPELRGRAKAINFGVIYGMGEQRLARETGIAPKEAREFIEAYFRTYPRVKAFHEEQIAKALREGFVETLFGRRRHIRDELLSPDGGVAANARNNAINTPIQGTAADLVKLAMVRLQERLRAAPRLDAHLLLQVHDELVLECPAESVEALTALVKETMETVVDLRVPLLVEVGSGTSWLEAH